MTAFVAIGIPQPQGSARPYTYRRKDGGIGARVTSDNAKLAAWRRVVSWEAKRAHRNQVLFDGAIRICAVFYLPRPKKPKASAPIVRPDVDKMARGLADAIAGVIFRDDAQVTEFKVSKVYAEPGTQPRTVVQVTALDPQRDLLSD